MGKTSKDEALSALCNGEIRRSTLPSRLAGLFICMSVAMAASDLQVHVLLVEHILK